MLREADEGRNLFVESRGMLESLWTENVRFHAACLCFSHTFKWKLATTGSFFMVNCLVLSW